MTNPEFDENGVVKSLDFAPKQKTVQNKEKTNRLKRREPMNLWTCLAWLFAGPLNPLALILIAMILLERSYVLSDIYGVLWLVCLPSALGAAIGLLQIDAHSATNLGIAWLAAKSMLIIAGVATAFFGTLAIAAVPLALVYIIAFALIIGVPAAVLAAAVVRVIAFEWKPMR